MQDMKPTCHTSGLLLGKGGGGGIHKCWSSGHMTVKRQVPVPVFIPTEAGPLVSPEQAPKKSGHSLQYNIAQLVDIVIRNRYFCGTAGQQ
jgi:hypothetical protein